MKNQKMPIFILIHIWQLVIIYIKFQITFFNNDISKKLRLDIQGMNEEGKLVSIQQLIQ